MPTWLGFCWTLPNTLIGLVVGLLTFQWPTLRDGALIFDAAPRGITWLMPRMNRAVPYLGYIVVAGTKPA